VDIAKPLKSRFSRSSTGEAAAGLVGSCLWRPGGCSRSWLAALPVGRLLGLFALHWRLLDEACSLVKAVEARERLWLIST
jgi:hypothetical protein